MTTAITETRNLPSVVYSVTDHALATLREQFAELKADVDHEGYERVRQAIGHVRGLRSKVEEERKKLKADSLEYGRRVDAEAKRITSALGEIEEPLRISKQLVDDERNRERNAAKQAEIDRLEHERAEAEEAKRREEERIHAENARLAAENARLKAERDAELAKQREEQDRVRREQEAERKRLDDERRAIEEEKVRQELAEYSRQQAEIRRKAIEDENQRREQEARERAERERLAAEAEAKRQEAMQPDVLKVQGLASFFRGLQMPEVRSPEAKAFLARLKNYLEEVAKKCEAFK